MWLFEEMCSKPLKRIDANCYGLKYGNVVQTVTFYTNPPAGPILVFRVFIILI
jgi:hypothetical protein